MSNFYVNAVFGFRQDTRENWETENPVLENGEPSIVSDDAEGEWLKIGDGNTPWNDLPYKAFPKGETGSQGGKGDPFTYEDFTPQQLNSLKGENGFSPQIFESTNDFGEPYGVQRCFVILTKDSNGFTKEQYVRIVDGENYILTENDKAVIADIVAEEIINPLEAIIDESGALL